MLMMVLSSAVLAIIIKLMDTKEVNGYVFEHPFFQTFIMFIGESLCIFVYLIQRQQLVKQYGSIQASPGMKKAVEEGMKTDCNPLLFAIPMLCDASASTMLLIAYINIPASITQMMGGFIVFVVSMMSIIFLKRRFYRHHWTGLALIFTGIGLVALSVFINKKSGGDERNNPALGISMLIGSILVQGCQYIVEEKLLGAYYLSPMKVVGWEGIHGTILYSIVLIILQYIPCDSEICSNGVVEDTRLALRQVGSSVELLIYVLLNIVLVGAMNGLGMVVTKYASSANRVTLSQSKTLIVWIFFLLAPVRGRETFVWLQLVGFIVVIGGVILYNEIIELPILGFDRYTKRGLEKNKLRAKSLNYEDEDADHVDPDASDVMTQDATNYTPSSPNKYDYQRNYKRLKNQMEDAAHPTGKGGDYMKMEGMD